MESSPTNRIATAAASGAAKRSTGSRGIFLIAVFDLIKAVLFLFAAWGVFRLVDRNTQVALTRLLHVFRLNGDHAIVRSLLVKANLITDPDKRILSGVLLLYTVLYAIEGIGLLLRRRWAEYFAAAMTAIPLPFEAHTLLHHATHAIRLLDPIFVLKLIVLVINVGIVSFLIYHLRRAAPRAVVEPISPDPIPVRSDDRVNEAGANGSPPR